MLRDTNIWDSVLLFVVGTAIACILIPLTFAILEGYLGWLWRQVFITKEHKRIVIVTVICAALWALIEMIHYIQE